MKTVQNGNKIKVHYKGTLDDGQMFDSSEGKEPLEFTVGKGMVIKGFDDGVLGMKIKETKNIHINCDEAYGKRNAKLVQNIPAAQLGGKKFEKGHIIAMRDDAGHVFNAVVMDSNKDGIMIDLNHPLAGQNLNFELTVVGIE